MDRNLPLDHQGTNDPANTPEDIDENEDENPAGDFTGAGDDNNDR